MSRFSISLPDWYERKLKAWARMKGTNRATLASNIVQARIEANWPEIEREMEAIAKYQGKTLEQVKAEWMNGNDSEEE